MSLFIRLNKEPRLRGGALKPKIQNRDPEIVDLRTYFILRVLIRSTAPATS
jgi:hypothetical protein